MPRARMLALAGLVAFLATAAPALSAPLTSVEGNFYSIFQQNQSSFSGLGMRVHLKSAMLVENITITPSIQYWRNRTNVPSFGVESSRSDARLGVDMRYTFLQYGVQPWAGAGWGLHFLDTSLNAPTLGYVDANDSVVKGGMSLGGGISTPIAGALTNDFGIEYDFLGKDSQLKLNFGVRYRF